MDMNQLFLLSIVATSIEMTACLVCARQLWRHRKEISDRSRRLLALGSFMSGILAALGLAGSIGSYPQFSQPHLLSPWIGLVYMSMHIVMTLYPIAVLRPDWLKRKQFFFLFLPVAVFALLFLFFSGNWTPLPYSKDIWENIGAPDVIARLVSLFCMIPYCFILFVLPYNYRKSSASFRWILFYSFSLTLICVVHIIVMLSYAGTLIIILPLLATGFYVLSTEYDLEERLTPGANGSAEVAGATSSAVSEPGVIPDLGSRIGRLMDEESVWKDPDLTLVGMARLCATNITYLNQAIRQETGGSFKDLVKAKRIAFVVEQLKETPDMDIQEAFFNAGYRSRTTAWRNFKEIMGVTPTIYLQSRK